MLSKMINKMDAMIEEMKSMKKELKKIRNEHIGMINNTKENSFMREKKEKT